VNRNLLRDQVRNLVREVLIQEASGGRVLDKITNQISRSIVDLLKSTDIRKRFSDLPAGGHLRFELSDLITPSIGPDLKGVESDLIGSLEGVGSIQVILEVTEDMTMWNAGAYMYNPDDRSKSELMIGMGLPRDYDLTILSQVIPEIKETVRHELEHGTESTEVLQSMDFPDNQFEDMQSMVDYYASDAETRGHVTGLYKRAKSLRYPISRVLENYLVGIYQKAIRAGMPQESADEGTRLIAEKWYDYLLSRYPRSERHVS